MTIPKDLTKVKSKVLFNLTARQLICFSAGAAIGVPLFFVLKNRIGVSTSALVMVLAMMPCFLFALYEKNGQPLEKVLMNIITTCFIRPKQRPYKTDNFYAALMRQSALDEEVRSIVQSKAVRKAEKSGRGRHCKGKKAQR